MKKRIISSLSLLLIFAACGTLSAQNARETTAKFNKTNPGAIIADYDQPADMVKTVLKERLEKEGLGKMKSASGYMRYSGVIWNAISSEKLDAYFKVDGKKGKSTITVLVSKGYDNFVTPASDARITDNVKAFLNGFNEHLTAYQKTLDVKAQEEAVKKAEKEQKELAKRNKELQEEKEKLERKHAEKQKALDAEREKLNNIKASVN
jgi:predicted ribosome quality control (RQC) complex YloA/Tae2 family protein